MWFYLVSNDCKNFQFHAEIWKAEQAHTSFLRLVISKHRALDMRKRATTKHVVTPDLK